MTVPSLKRVKITSRQALTSWLSNNGSESSQIMLVTFSSPASDKHVSRADIAHAIETFGWTSLRRYTLTPELLGHVIQRQTP